MPKFGQDWSKFANEVPVERSLYAEFTNYHLNSLNGKLNGSRPDNMHGPYGPKTTKADTKS